MKCAVYRCYDAEGALLYIGASNKPKDRLKAHKAKTDWGKSIASHDEEWFSSREKAIEKEASAIKAERPPFNKHWVHNRGSEAADFLNKFCHKRVAKVVGVHPNAIYTAKREGVMPARWYVPLLDAGFNPPFEAFRWRRAPYTKKSERWAAQDAAE